MNSIKIEPETDRGQVYRLTGLPAPFTYKKILLGVTTTTTTSGIFEIVNIDDAGNRYVSYLIVFESNGVLHSVACSKAQTTSICKALNEHTFEEILDVQERDEKLFWRVRTPSEIVKRATLRDHEKLIDTVWDYLKDLYPREISVIVSELRRRIPPV